VAENGERTWSPSAVIHGDGYIYAVTGHVLYKLRSNDLGDVIPYLPLPDGYEPESNLLVFEQLFRQNGLLVRTEPLEKQSEPPLSEVERERLAQKLSQAGPLSELIISEREEQL